MKRMLMVGAMALVGAVPTHAQTDEEGRNKYGKYSLPAKTEAIYLALGRVYGERSLGENEKLVRLRDGRRMVLDLRQYQDQTRRQLLDILLRQYDGEQDSRITIVSPLSSRYGYYETVHRIDVYTWIMYTRPRSTRIMDDKLGLHEVVLGGDVRHWFSFRISNRARRFEEYLVLAQNRVIPRDKNEDGQWDEVGFRTDPDGILQNLLQRDKYVVVDHDDDDFRGDHLVHGGGFDPSNPWIILHSPTRVRVF